MRVQITEHSIDIDIKPQITAFAVYNITFHHKLTKDAITLLIRKR